MVAYAHTFDLPAERARLMAMAEYGKVQSRERWTKSEGLKIHYFIDFGSALGSERFLWSVAGLGFEDRGEAERIRQRISIEASRPGSNLRDAIDRYRHPRSRQNLVLTHAERWLREVGPTLAPRTTEKYKTSLRCHFGFWSGKGIQEVTAANVRTWVMELREKGLSDQSVRHQLSPLRLIVRRYREDHPEMPEPVWPRLRVEREARAPMPLEDILTALAQIPEPDAGVYLCAFYTLCRPGEARAALIEDYDFRSGRLTICRAMKTDSSASEALGATKTGASGIYTLPGDLRAWIARYRGDARLDRGAPLFPNSRTGRHWHAKMLRRHWQQACERAGVDAVPVYRALKHSAGTALIESGLSREDLQAAYRHKSARMTMVYELEDTRRRERATKRLEELVGEKLENAPGNTPATVPSRQKNRSRGPTSQESGE